MVKHGKMGEYEYFESTVNAILEVPDAFKSVAKNPVILKCREISPYYIDNRIIFSYPEYREIIVKNMADLVHLLYRTKTIDKLTTTETAGLLICSPVGDRLKIGVTYVKKAKKGYGLEKQLEGKIKKGEYVVAVDDLTTKGGTAVNCVNVVKAFGGEIDKYFVIFDRRQGAEEDLADLDVELDSLACMCSEFVDMALRKEVIRGEDYTIFKEYAPDPTKWSRKYLKKNPDYLRKKIEEAIKNGRIVSNVPFEVLTIGHPELKEEFTPLVREWLEELEVINPVPEFGYEGKN